MKKLFLFLILWFTAITTGCSKAESTADSGKPQIYTSFYAIYDFVSAIGGDKIEVHNMVPSGTEPHDWEPSTMDMARLYDADILFYNGMGMESWIDKVADSVGDDVEYVMLSEGIADENSSDPHIWLDPDNALKMAEKIKDTLCEKDAVFKDYYEKNYYKLAAEIEAVDKEYTEAFTGVKENKIVVAHEAYGWLCKAYGLEQIAIEGISAESEPSPSKMKELVNTLKQNNIKYVFYEELVSPKVAQSLADEAGAELLELNPFEGLSDEEIAEGKTYTVVMRDNLENLKKALYGE